MGTTNPLTQSPSGDRVDQVRVLDCANVWYKLLSSRFPEGKTCWRKSLRNTLCSYASVEEDIRHLQSYPVTEEYSLWDSRTVSWGSALIDLHTQSLQSEVFAHSCVYSNEGTIVRCWKRRSHSPLLILASTDERSVDCPFAFADTNNCLCEG